MADLHIVWAPRRWINTRTIETVANGGHLDLYTGYGWIVGTNAIHETPPRKQATFTHLPAGDFFHWLWKITDLFYIGLNAPPLSALKVSANNLGVSYTQLTFNPAGSLSIGITHRPHMVVSSATLMYMTSDSHGLLKVNVGTSQVDQVTGATDLVTVVQHLSRLVGVAKGNIIRYSVPGNWDDWTTTTNGAGSITLLLNNESLLGLRVVNNVLVILASRSIYIGYPTGVTNPPYRIEQILSFSDVIESSRSLVQYENTLYYKGITSIYKFENFKQVDIGNPQLMNMYRKETAANILTGMITYNLRDLTSFNAEDRLKDDPHYCLVPTTSFQLTTQIPMFYNIAKQTWQPIIGTQHKDLGDSLTKDNGFRDIVEPLQTGSPLNDPIEFIHWSGNKIEYFSDGSGSTAATIALLQSPIFEVGEPFRAYRLDRILLKYSLYSVVDPDPNKTYSITIACTNREDSGSTETFNVTLYTNASATSTKYKWIDVANKNLVGQHFRVTFSFTQDPAYRLEIVEFDMYFVDAGDLIER